MDVISTSDLAAVRRMERKIRSYRWQTKGFFMAQKSWAKYYLPTQVRTGK